MGQWFRSVRQGRRGRAYIGPGIAALVIVGLGLSLIYAGRQGATSDDLVTNVGTARSYQAFFTEPARRGGTIVVSAAEEPDSANPLFADRAVDFVIVDAIWGGPVVSGADLRWYADELTEVPTLQNGDVSPDGLTVTLHLRHDLRWSDGQPLTSADYRYGWQVLVDPASGGGDSEGYRQIVAVTTPDPYTVVLHYAQPFGPYLRYLPFPLPQHAWGGIADRDLAGVDHVRVDPDVTDGPYRIWSHTGQTYTLVANPYYHSTTFHGPFLDTLVIRGYDGVDGLIAAVRAGQTDIGLGYTIADLARLEDLPAGVHVRVSPALAVEHLGFNMSNRLFQGDSGYHVRKAIAEAVDRCTIVRAVSGGSDCQRYLANTIEPAPAFDTAAVVPPPFDLNAARADMQAAGYIWHPDGSWVDRNGRPFPVLQFVTTADTASSVLAAQILQRQLKVLGIRVQLHFYRASELFGSYTDGGILARGRYDLAEFAYTGAPDPDGWYAVFVSAQIPSAQSPSGGNDAYINDEEIDHDLDIGRDTQALIKRIQYYQDFQQRLIRQVYVIPLYMLPNIATVNGAVANYHANPAASRFNEWGNAWNCADWWRA